MKKKKFDFANIHLYNNPAFIRNTMTQNLIQFIKHLVLFTDEEIQDIQHLFIEKNLKKGKFWVKEGEFNSDVLFVNKGMLRSYFVKEEVEKTFDLIIEDQITTATESYSSGLPSIDYIQAVEDTHLTIISKNDIELLYTKSPKWERVVRIIFEANTFKQEIRIRSFIAETAQERYERLAKEQPELIQRTPQIYLANFLGITPQSLSRLRRKIISK